MSHEAIIERRDGERGARCVVTYADDEIWIAPEVFAELHLLGHVAIPGGLERDGDLIRFGVEGEGLGRLTYRLAGYAYDGFHHVAVAKRVRADAAEDGGPR